MKLRLIFICLVSLFGRISLAQLGGEMLTDVYTFVSPIQFNTAQDLYPQQLIAPRVAVHYWKRLKNYRLEFLPSFNLSYMRSKPNQTPATTAEFLEAQLALPLLFYLFSFEDDCNCPTFGKGNSIMEDGFHLILNPKLAWSSKTLTFNQEQREISGIVPIVELGAGLDIGLSKAWTLTPIVAYGLRFADKIPGVLTQTDPIRLEKSSNVSIGLKLNYRVKRRR